MNLADFVIKNNGAISPNGVKLSKPQLNLVSQLDGMNVAHAFYGISEYTQNPISGYRAKLNPFTQLLVLWVYEVAHSQGFMGPMSFRGHKVSVQMFDRVRYLILAIDAEAFSNFID